mmetsp:Transcript_92718/g.289081  ORF Transcript_92718/g.289081 Transcript_92718/m.289081 type:complete len:178 (-) Transcript_92718:105-638(-)|eukprot:CAMPEP_0204581792 /NCGR_PEP_ID=MMETSP0661-20131031/44850_1 /ASSEMBLY_ACC=CAM_ASM_000606 /TAXON_ID=109239 /ORGANISM="Alexandrium margalefi, Strain AMGDE01CS-322" /LENGTH=177 /DNA_ID=CAMNT_0051591017 /DNA_START=51 /DNA_END=584 /DNA_ORIENTATION=-
MAGIRVSVKYAKDTRDLDFPSADATLGELRDAIEQQMSVPRSVQGLICAGKRWQGLAFGDDLKLLDAAGAKGSKEVLGVKTISVMLMAPAGADGGGEVERCAAQLEEARAVVAALPPEPEALRRQLLLADDLLTRAATGLDDLSLVGAQRERRRELLAQIDAAGQDVAARKAALKGP